MGLKVLLADDETEYVDTLAERLELRDYSVRVVHDGISALTAVEEDMPDVVVLDLFMPGLPGNKVLAELNRRYPKLPVILITIACCLAFITPAASSTAAMLHGNDWTNTKSIWKIAPFLIVLSLIVASAVVILIGKVFL